MGIRNKVVKDGFVMTNVDGDTGLFGFEQQFLVTATPVSGVQQSITTGLTILSGANITASLPTLSTATAGDGTVNNGFVCTVLLASADIATLSASSPINGGAWTIACPSSAFRTWTCVGVTGLDAVAGVTSGWFVSSGTRA